MKVCVCDCGVLGWQGCSRKWGISVRKGKGGGKPSNQKSERKREKQGSKRSTGRSHGKRRGWRKGRGTTQGNRVVWGQERCAKSDPWQDYNVEQETLCSQIRQTFLNKKNVTG